MNERNRKIFIKKVGQEPSQHYPKWVTDGIYELSDYSEHLEVVNKVMYEALKGIAESHNGDCYCDYIMTCIYCNVRKALAKAEGKE